TSLNGEVALSLGNNPGNATLTQRGGSLMARVINGQATFANLVINKAGRGYTLFASCTNGQMAVSNPFNVSRPPMTLTWTGRGNGQGWSDPENWDKKDAPWSGDSLVFPGGAPKNSANDLASLSINVIDFRGAGYTLTGNAIGLTGGIREEG